MWFTQIVDTIARSKQTFDEQFGEDIVNLVIMLCCIAAAFFVLVAATLGANAIWSS